MNDIANREDIGRLVSHFYERLLKDKDLRHIFEPLNLKEHLPRIIHFWSFVLLDEEGYRTNVFEKHMSLPIKPPFFDIWLKHFTDSVDALFAGEKAEMAKQRATVIAYTFKNKWQTLKGGSD